MDALSDLERIKADSRFLRGAIAAGLADPVTGAIADDDTKLLKFHGSYQQDDRDLREERRRQKLEPAYAFMIRARLPGGVLTPAQWLAFDAIAREHANGTLRITTRQTFQWHGVRKRHLKPAIAAINRAMASTIAACGDVNRNVVCSANPLQSSAHAHVHAWAARLSDHLQPRTRAYGEIWLDDELIVGAGESEPLYGATYLPRKFKTGLALAENVIAIQRDWGDRGERRHARLKYTLDRRGVGAFVAELARRCGFALEPARPFAFEHSGDRHGWVEDHHGRWHLTLHIESGRLADTPQRSLLSGMREIAHVHAGGFRLTCNQNLIIADVAPDARAGIDALVARHGLDGYRRQSGIRRHALACVALPTCGLAMAESERYLPDLLQKLETMLDRHGLLDAPILLRLSGCPNGCSRPYLGEIALVGKGPGRYNLMLGADHRGQRLNRLYRENVDEDAILAALETLFARFAAERDGAEHFGDFLLRTDIVAAPRAIPAEVIA
jgi:sulfite reductase (NADPH) hemoprotein beta-component